MTKFMKMQIIWASVVFVLILIIGFLGVYALQKSMTIKMSYTVSPNIRCEIEMKKTGESTFTPIFSNLSGHEFILDTLQLDEATGILILNNTFNGGIGAGFDLNIKNYNGQKLFVSVSGEGVSYDSVAINKNTGTAQEGTINVSSVSNNVVIKFVAVEDYTLTANFTGVQFDLTNYEDNTLLRCGNNYYIPLGEDLKGKLVSSVGATILFDSISTVNYTYTNNILTIFNANLSNTTLTARGVYYITTTFTNVSINTGYTSNTVQVVESSVFIFANTNLQAKLVSSTANYHPVISVLVAGTNTLTSNIATYFNNEYILNIPLSLINGNISITASSVVDTYTVTFDAQNGTALTTRTVAYGSTYGTISDPARAGYTFKGWGTKNLFDASADILNWDVSNTYDSTINTFTCGTGFMRLLPAIALTANQTYTFSFYVRSLTDSIYCSTCNFLYINNGCLMTSNFPEGPIINSSWQRKTCYITYQYGDSNTIYGRDLIHWYFGNSGNSNTVQLCNIQIEVGSVATDYEPYVAISSSTLSGTTMIKNFNHTYYALWSKN